MKLLRFRFASEICSYASRQKWPLDEFKAAISLLHNDFESQQGKEKAAASVVVSKTIVTKGKRPVNKRRYLNK